MVLPVTSFLPRTNTTLNESRRAAGGGDKMRLIVKIGVSRSFLESMAVMHNRQAK